MAEIDAYAYRGYPSGMKYPWQFAMPSEKERDLRWQTIRNYMKKQDIDCLVVGAPMGFMPVKPMHLVYIANYIPYSNRGTLVVFPREGEPQLAVSMAVGPQFVHIGKEISWIKDIVGSLSPEQEIVKKIKALKLESGRLGIVGYRSGVFSASVYDTLRSELPRASFTDATGPLTEAMHEVSRTSAEELGLLKKLCEIIDLSFEAVRDSFKPGVKECELWATLESVLVRNGGWYGHFILATSGANPTFLRAPPSQNVLRKGDVVEFEIDPVYAGIMSQTAYSLSLGRPNAKVQKMFDLCDSLYSFAIEELEKKRPFDDIETDLVRRILEAGYLPMTPQVHYFNLAVAMPPGRQPLPGDHFTIHPNICTTDYTAGAKFGDLVRVSPEGKVRSLLKVPAKLNII